MPYDTLQYTRCVVIVHGKSELIFVRYICSNLRLPYKIISNNNGKSSIQINGLGVFLNKPPFHNLQAFAKKYSVEYDKKEKKLKNFKLFIIMDTDDCDQNTKEKYISGELFKGHPLQEYIVSIYNSENFENVMIKAGLITKRISAKEKGYCYDRIFPINTHHSSYDTINQVKSFAYSIKDAKETNLLKFVEYCIKQIPGEHL